MAKNAPAYPRHIIAVRLEAALRVRPFISKDACRWYLNGTRIEPAEDGGAVCVATDGHRLGIRHDQNGRCLEPAIVRLSPLLKLTKEPKWLVVTLTAETKGFVSILPVKADDAPETAMQRVDEAELRIGDAIIDGTYPDWQRIVPTPQPTDMLRGFKAEYYASFGSFLAISGADGVSAHLVTDSADPEFLGVLMPLRVDAPKVPSWLRSNKMAKAA